MPKLTGFQVLEQLRAEGCRVPVLLTATARRDSLFPPRSQNIYNRPQSFVLRGRFFLPVQLYAASFSSMASAT